MQFTCSQVPFNRMLTQVNHAVAKGTGAPPIATNIRVTTDVESHRIRLDATNLSIGITGWVEAEKGLLMEAGTVAIPAKIFTNIIGVTEPGQIEISSDPTTYMVRIKGPRGVVNVRGVDPTEFPFMPGPELSAKPTLLKAALLKEVVREVSIAIDEDGAREVFTNILLQIEKEQITFAAADGSGKLAFRPLPLPAESEIIKGLLVPARSLADLTSILPAEGMVEIRLTPNTSQIILSTQSLVLSSILSSGTFPNYRKVVPSEVPTRVTVKTDDLRHIVQLTSPFATLNGDAGYITITPSKGIEPGTLTIQSQAVDVGDNCNTIIGAIEGVEQRVTFNITYLAKILSVISAPELVFEIGKKSAPVGIIRPSGASTCVHSFGSMGAAS